MFVFRFFVTFIFSSRWPRSVPIATRLFTLQASHIGCSCDDKHALVFFVSLNSPSPSLLSRASTSRRQGVPHVVLRQGTHEPSPSLLWLNTKLSLRLSLSVSLLRRASALRSTTSPKVCFPPPFSLVALAEIPLSFSHAEIFTGAATDPHYQQREVTKTGNNVAHGKMNQ